MSDADSQLLQMLLICTRKPNFSHVMTKFKFTCTTDYLCVIMFNASINASRKLFSRFLFNLFQLSMSFFEHTPIGQIINRCSNDFDTIDNIVIFTLRSTFNAILGFLICFFVIAYYLPESIPMMITIFIPFFFLQVN